MSKFVIWFDNCVNKKQHDFERDDYELINLSRNGTLDKMAATVQTKSSWIFASMDIYKFRKTSFNILMYNNSI